MMNDIKVARLGKTVGLKGDLKLQNFSDFPEQYKVGATFFTSSDKTLKVSAYNAKKGLIRFDAYENIEDAKSLVNLFLYSSIEETKANCTLNENEFFWFDIEGCSVFEEDVLLGRVVEVERIGSQDYLHVESEESFKKKGVAAHFLIPYIDRFIISVKLSSKRIDVIYARDLMESL